MLTIVFYSTDGASAKLLSRELVAQKPHEARVYEVSVWDGRYDRCDAVIIQDDVPGWQRKRIERTYGDKIINLNDDDDEENNNPNADEHKSDAGNMGSFNDLGSGSHPASGSPDHVKRAVHKGHGKWFVMRGDEIVSGPHDKDTVMQKVNDQ